jgi:hypothetical protein
VSRELQLHQRLANSASSVETLAEAAFLVGRSPSPERGFTAAEARAIQQALGERIRAVFHVQLWTEIREHRERPRLVWLDRRFTPLTVNALVLAAVAAGFSVLALVCLRHARPR